MKILLCDLLLLLSSWCLAATPNQTLSADQLLWQLWTHAQLIQAPLKTWQQDQQQNYNQAADQLIPPVQQLISSPTWLDQLIVSPYFVGQLKAVNLLLETYLINKVIILSLILSICYKDSPLGFPRPDRW
jgi:hypothetical protein